MEADFDARVPEGLQKVLEKGCVSGEALLELLDCILQHFGCTVGTLHFLDAATKTLELQAQRGVPAHLLDRVNRVPVGKGMAGLAAERRAPVKVCNLQTDDSGVAKPAARETGMRGSIAVPMMLEDGTLLGVLGVGKGAEHDFDEEETALLGRIGGLIAQKRLR